MSSVANILGEKFISYFLIISFMISALGFFNPNWYSLILYQLLFLLFFSSTINKEGKKWIIIALVLPTVFIIKQNLDIPKIIQGSNVFIGGEKYKDSIFKKNLPKKIFDKLNTDFKAVFPKSISGPDNKLFNKSVSQIFNEHSETKYVQNINWDNRFQLQIGAFNNTKYNAYGNQQPEREKLPFFVKYSFPEDYSKANAKFCWQGIAFIGKELKEIEFKKLECIDFKSIAISRSEFYDIWLIESGKSLPLKAKLILPLKYKVIFYLNHLLNILSGLLILILLFKKIDYKKAALYMFSFLLSLIFSFYFNTNLIDKFILFEGGNDGLLYVHFAHLISDFIAIGDYKSAFMGGEKAYDLMPFYRYIWIINFILFEESPWILLFIITFFPLIIYKIFNELLGRKWAQCFLIFWFFIPLFEAFGFFHFYYVKLTLRGFGEPLSYLCFLTALLFLIKFNKHSYSINYFNSFIFGFLLALAIGLRANILPACLVMIVFYILLNFKRNKKNIFFLLLGFSLILIMPIHNYIFTKKFIPLTIAAYKDWNLGARPSDYIILLKSILILNLDLIVFKKITNHINGEIKLYEVWYHLSIIVSIYYAIRKKSPFIMRCIALSSLSLISLLLFYHVGGRYSYLSWTLSLIVLSYSIKNDFLPFLKKI